MASASGPFKFLAPRLRPQAADFCAAAAWGVSGVVGAFWIVQPFDWLKKQFLDKPESEQ